jgi:hypothetical protein
MFMRTALRFLVFAGAVDGACFDFLQPRRFAAIVNPRTIKVTTLGGPSAGDATEVPVWRGQTVRDLKSRADLRATLGPHISLITLINNDGDHVLQDDDGLDGVTDITALKVFTGATVARNELMHAIEENDADMFQVAEMGEDIFIRKAPAGVQTKARPSRGLRLPKHVPLYHMFHIKNKNVVLAEFGLLEEGVRNAGTYFFAWPENWTPEKVGAVDFEVWEDFHIEETRKFNSKYVYW